MGRALSRPALVGALLAVALVSASAVAILGLQSYASRHERGRVSLGAVQAATATLSQLEWQAVAERGVSDEVSERIEAARRAARASLVSAIDEIHASDEVTAVERRLDRYLGFIDTEFALLGAGRMEEAEIVDEEQVDPAYEALSDSIAAAQSSAAIRAQDANGIARLGTVALLLLGLVATGLLFWRLSATKQQARNALVDPLTGLANRTLLTDRLTHALAVADRAGSRVAALLIDLDDFKRVNDSLGHAAGDTLLRAVGDRLREAARSSDTVARLGGDEFAILLEVGIDGEGTAQAASRLAAALARPFPIDGHSVVVTVSIGGAVSEPGATSGDELLRNADLAMYAGKRKGKRCVVMYEPSMYEALTDRMELETDLREALARNEISVAYQPIVDIETGDLRSLEALARWNHPVRGLVGPALFIPLAEETGMIHEIGRFVLREATTQLRRWQSERQLVPPLGISVNVSPVQLQSPKVVDDVRDVLRETGVDPGTVTLEITESVLVERGEGFRTTLEALAALGVVLAVDDFGTGYSSLASLSRFPVHTLKIDRSFVASIADDPNGLELIRSIVELGRALGLGAVAEGIETTEQAEALGGLDRLYGQGYHFARPLSPEDADRYLAERPFAAPVTPAPSEEADVPRVQEEAA